MSVCDGRFAAAPTNLVASISGDGNSLPYVCRALIVDNDDTASDKIDVTPSKCAKSGCKD